MGDRLRTLGRIVTEGEHERDDNEQHGNHAIRAVVERRAARLRRTMRQQGCLPGNLRWSATAQDIAQPNGGTSEGQCAEHDSQADGLVENHRLERDKRKIVSSSGGLNSAPPSPISTPIVPIAAPLSSGANRRLVDAAGSAFA